VALAATAAVVLVRWLLDPWLGDFLPLVTLYGAVAVASWYGGYRPALLATALGFLACDYLFIQPRGSFTIHDSHHYIGLVLYLFTCSLIIGIGEAMRLARRRTQEGQELLRVTFASMGDAVITTDAAGRVTSLNTVAESLTRWPQQEAVGQPLDAVFRIVNVHTRLPVENPVKKVLAEGKVVGLANHTSLIARDGTERPIDDSAAPIRDAEGVLRGVVLIFRDITERRKAEEARSRLAVIVESSDDAIISKDLDGTIRSWNREAERLYGYAAEEVIGKPVSLLLPPDQPDELPGIMERLKRGERIDRYETVRVRKDGQRVEVALRISPVKDEAGRMIGASVIAQDITARKQAEDDLRRAEERVRSVVNTVLDGIVTIDESGTVETFNHAAEKLFGYQAEEVVGQNVKMLMPEPYRSAHDGYLANYHRTGQAKIIGIGRVVEGRRKDGSSFPMDLAVSEFRLGERRYFTGIVRDITERHRAERLLRESEAQFRQMADAMPQIVWTARPDGYLDYYNERWYEYTGFSRGEYGQQSWEPILHPDDVQRCVDIYFGCIKAETPYQIEYRFKDRKTGGYRWFLGRAMPVRDEQGRVVRWFGTCTDIDDTKRAEEALQEADRRKDEFLATLAHELRNPLAPIRNAVELLRRAEGQADLSEKARGMMERQLGLMVRLIDDLLDISRITRGKLQLRKERVELAAVVPSAVEAARPSIDAQAHELTVTLPPQPVYLDADPVRLAQVFLNLLTNAAKYTEKGGHIWLTAERQGGDVVVSVRDTGIGIAAEHLPRLFEMFSQLTPALERSQGGLGIGLALVRGLVELHGGSVEARSGGPGLGSEFIVCLPVVEAPVVTPQEPSGNGEKVGGGRQCRILVVDDNRDAADSLAMMLRLLGHDIQTAHDGLEAVQAAASFRPEIVLLDIGLPKLNGYEAARHIRAQPWGGHMALIALTGWGQEEDKRRSLEAGFDHHLTKPVVPAALEKLLALIAPVRRQ
jgi:PAS domain S-box-containing protein